MPLPRRLWKAWERLERALPDEWALRLMYRRIVGRPLHLRRPRAFGEKLQWLKLHYRPAVLAQLADKYTVRRFVADRVGPHLLNDLIGAWDDPADVPFDRLPPRYVLKVSSASNANLFCRAAGDLRPDDARRRLAGWMRWNHYRGSREWAYKHCRPRVIAEPLLSDGSGVSPVDYKFYCFDGRPALVHAAVGRHERLTGTLFDPHWNRLPFRLRKHPVHPADVPPPATLGDMLDAAARLSAGFPFVRADFYCIGGRTVFGEMTWYPGSGLVPFDPFEHDLGIGDLLRLPPPYGPVA